LVVEFNFLCEVPIEHINRKTTKSNRPNKIDLNAVKKSQDKIQGENLIQIIVFN